MALRRVMLCLDGGRIPLSAEERAERPGPYPYYGASSVVDFVDDYLFDEDLVLLGEDGAQLGDPAFPIAQRVSGKIWVNNHAHVLRVVGYDADLLVAHLNTFDRVAHLSGATREKLTQDDMKTIPIPAAPDAVQASTALRLLAFRTYSHALRSPLLQQLDLLREHREALIAAAVTGQLEVAGAAR